MSQTAEYTWNQFIDDCKVQAATFTNFDHLIVTLARNVRKLSPQDKQLNARFKNLCNKPPRPYVTDVCIDEKTCKLMLVLLQPNSEIGLHNHPYQSGFIFCWHGEVHIEAFDEQTSTTTTAILQKRYSSTLQPGNDASLLPDSANIHSLKANKLTLLIDVFIPPIQEKNLHLCKRYTLQKPIANTNLYHAAIIPNPKTNK